MGTGAGFPGLILAIMGYKRVSVIDSNGKKIDFINSICKKLDIKVNVFLNRIEKLNNKKFDFLTSRALAKLNKLLTYSHNFIHKDTVLIFLKGKTVNEEIKEARKYWRFKSIVQQSCSDDRGKVLIVKYDVFSLIWLILLLVRGADYKKIIGWEQTLTPDLDNTSGGNYEKNLLYFILTTYPI